MLNILFVFGQLFWSIHVNKFVCSSIIDWVSVTCDKTSNQYFFIVCLFVEERISMKKHTKNQSMAHDGPSLKFKNLFEA